MQVTQTVGQSIIGRIIKGINLNKELITLFVLLFFVSCAPVASNESISIVETETPKPIVDASPRAMLSTPTTQETMTPSPTKTARPSFTPTAFPDYSNIPPLNQLVITKEDVCLAKYSLPVIGEYRNVRETDLTSSTDPKYCLIDCVRRSWNAYNGANFTFTVVRAASPKDATALLEEELDRVQQLYSDREKYIGVGFDDPYAGEGDDSWAGKPYPGTTGYSAVVRSSVVVIMEWTQVPQGFDIEFDFSETDEFARIQFGKIANALGTSFPSTNDQSICTP